MPRPWMKSKVSYWPIIGVFILLVLLCCCSEGYYAFVQEPFVTAAGNGDIKQVRSLLRFGASPDDEQDDNGGTALIAAAAGGHADVVWLLISHGANVNKSAPAISNDDHVISPLQAAQGHPEIVRMLKDAGAK